MVLAVFVRRWWWIGLGGALGILIGLYGSRAIPPLFESQVPFTVEREPRILAQGAVVAAAIDAVARNHAIVPELNRVARLPLRRIRTVTIDRDTVAVLVQGYGADAVQQAAQEVADRVTFALSDSGPARDRASFVERGVDARSDGSPGGLRSFVSDIFAAGVTRGRAQGRVDQQVLDRVPAPIIQTTRPWSEVKVHAGAPSPSRLIRRQFVLAGFFGGSGVAITLLAFGIGVGRLRRSL